MAAYLDRKYLLLISSKLRNFKQKKQDLFNFSCHLCGDSKSNTLKARAYVYERQNNYLMTCFNCSVTIPFRKFLKFVDPMIFKEYCFEKFTNNRPPEAAPATDKPKPIPIPKSTASADLPTIADLEDEHYAKVYISTRKIPKNLWSEIYFAQDFKSYMDRRFPDHGKELKTNDPRIVLLYTDQHGNITHVCGRSLASEPKLRYIKIKVADSDRKIFGLDRIDLNAKRIYITEGEFDSMFVDNCIAAGDSSLTQIADYVSELTSADVVLVWDNEPRNKDIVKHMEAAIDLAHKIVVWPSNMIVKDVNDLIVYQGKTSQEVMHMLEENTYSGLIANLEFTEWKKC